MYTFGSVDRAYTFARLAQLVERKPFKLVVVGSSPTVGIFTPLAQLVEHWSYEPKVDGSNPPRSS